MAAAFEMREQVLWWHFDPDFAPSSGWVSVKRSCELSTQLVMAHLAALCHSMAHKAEPDLHNAVPVLHYAVPVKVEKKHRPFSLHQFDHFKQQ